MRYCCKISPGFGNRKLPCGTRRLKDCQFASKQLPKKNPALNAGLQITDATTLPSKETTSPLEKMGGPYRKLVPVRLRHGLA